MPRVPDITILRDHKDWCVVAKPAHLAVHRSAMVRDRTVLLQLVRNTVGCRVNAVHRLDRPTSGCIIFAKNKPATAMIQAAMRLPAAQKTYLLCARGWAEPKSSVLIDIPLTHDGITKEAQTYIECLGASREPRCALILARPRTGRWHQIRRHIKRLSMPILMDSLHGDTQTNRWWRETYGLRRLALHCHSLHVPLPDGTVIEASCPLPQDLSSVFQQLPWWEEAVAHFPALAET
jgi:tRNA pseudouridine65 synthase